MKHGCSHATEPPPDRVPSSSWYDEEHLAGLAIPGFRPALRWVADVPPGSGKTLRLRARRGRVYFLCALPARTESQHVEPALMGKVST